MSLLRCPECNNMVSDKAYSCPTCGYPISENIQQIKVTKKSTNYDINPYIENENKSPQKINSKTENIPKKSTKGKLIVVIICMLIIIVLLVNEIDKTSKAKNGNEKNTENNNTVSVTVDQFNDVLSSMPVYIVSKEILVQSDNFKSLYPDILRVSFKNNTDLDIKKVRVAFACWDANNLPVKFEARYDMGGKKYIKFCDYDDVNLTSGQTYNKEAGFSLDASSEISFFEAIVVGYEAYDGSKWKNPYCDEWSDLYEGKKYSTESMVKVDKNDLESLDVNHKSSDEEEKTKIESQSNLLTRTELEQNLSKQDIKVINSEFEVYSGSYKTIYSGTIVANVKNESNLEIKDITLAYMAWDENNLPVKIKGVLDITESYIKKLTYDNANIMPNSTFGEGKGLGIDSNCNISKAKAIVYSYEAYDGTKWKNPLYEDWCKIYEGKKLEE